MNMIALGCAKAVTGEIIQETMFWSYSAFYLIQYLEKLIHLDLDSDNIIWIQSV